MSPPDEIFISYAHADNQVLPGETQGWVYVFDQALRVFLGEKISPTPTIWRDNELGKNDVVSQTLLDHVSSIGIMVSILSPKYLASDWCLREVEYFCDAAKQKKISLRIDNKSRIIRVQKSPLDQEPPEVFNDLIGFNFYDIETSNKPTEFRLEFGDESRRKLLRKIDELAYEIKSLIQAIKQHTSNDPFPDDPSPEPIAVYLAETTSDLDEARSNIKADLLQREYLVLPDRSLSYKAKEFEEQVRADLERSKLSIHLVGDNYGFVPDGENRSIIELQHELAVERNQKDGDFTRVIWMPASAANDTRPEDIRRRRLADAINSTLVSNTEFVETSLEDVKTVIQDKLKSPTKTSDLLQRTGKAPLIFVICDKVDLDGGRQLYELLYKLEYEVVLPSMAENSDPLDDLQRKLHDAHAVIIYRDQTPDFWLYTKLQELQKIRATRRSEFLAEAVYIGGEKTDDKEHFRTRQATLIKNYEEISIASLEPFLNLIEQKRREQAS